MKIITRNNILCYRNTTGKWLGYPQQATVTTQAVTNIITGGTATANGNVTNANGMTVTARGVCWSSTNPLPTKANSFASASSGGTGAFTATMSSLTLGTKYYVRAWAETSDGTSYANPSNGVVTMFALQVGDTYQGGKVAYIYNAGDPGYVSGELHGIIAQPSDYSAGVVWGCNGTSIGTTSNNLGEGYNNTTEILAGCADSPQASEVYYDGTGGYNDWFLPSTDELAKLYINRLAIGGFASGIQWYWTSTEFSSTSAQVIGWHNGVTANTAKTGSWRVRGCRYF